MNSRGFTLTELMIVVALIALLSVMGGIQINSRLQTSRLEDTAKQLVSDLNYARSAAMLKGCVTRIMFCNNKNCSSRITKSTSGVVTDNTTPGTPAKYYAIYRQNQAADSTASCYSSTAVALATDGFTYWDLDRRPQMTASGIVFKAFYTSANSVPGYAQDDFITSATVSSNTIWFSSQTGNITVPNTTLPLAANNSTIALQIQPSTCTPSSDTECAGYFITVGDGGLIEAVKCSGGGRSANATNLCF